MINTTVRDYIDRHADENQQAIWLRDRQGDQFTERTWSDSRDEINAVAAWLEERYGNDKTNVALLSRNRAHWVLADNAIIFSGNVTVPMFTTLTAPTADYILNFTNARLLILGESDNWRAVSDVLPDDIDIVTLPGVAIDREHVKWDDIVAEFAGREPLYRGRSDDLVSLVFTSGTTGVPKGVMQTHESMLKPMRRVVPYLGLRENPRFLSYLPLSHIAERQLVGILSLLLPGTVSFNESLPTLLRDMADTKPNFMFGPPRVWEQLQQGVLASFGTQQALDKALEKDRAGVGLQVRTNLGLNDADYLLTAAAPTPPALIKWYEKLGFTLLEGFGQTEIMATSVNTKTARKIGSIGRVVGEIDLKISAGGELIFRAPGAAVGYYKQPEKTAETFVDGWVHTGDKGYVDEDGYVFLTGRVKDHFKTIQGKYVAPAPIESSFAENDWTEQLCLLGRGYSKTVVVCVLSDIAQKQNRELIEKALIEKALEVNDAIDHHARVGAIMITRDPWTIANDVLTPTLKIRREQVENRFGERAQELARHAAEQHDVLLEWLD